MFGRRVALGLISASVACLGLAACPAGAAAKPGPLKVAVTHGIVTGGQLGDSTTARAICPEGTHLLGGGFTMDQPPFIHPNNIGGIVTESKKYNDTDWQVTVRTVPGLAAANVLFDTIATCRKKGVPSTTEVQTTVPSTGAGAASGPTAVASCPNGGKALAGGFTLGPPVSAPFTSPVVVESRRSSPTTWQVSAAEGAGTSVTGYAECADHSTRLHRGPRTFATSPGTSRAVTTVGTSCPDRKRRRQFMAGFWTNTGLSNGSNGVLYPFESEPQPGSDKQPLTWHTTVIHNTFAGPPLKVIARAYCV